MQRSTRPESSSFPLTLQRVPADAWRWVAYVTQMNERRVELNEYLVRELGLDIDERREITADWPFQLTWVRTLHGLHYEAELFSFESDGEQWYGVSGDRLWFCSAAGLTPADIETEVNGSKWVADRGPVDLDTSVIGGDVPPLHERRDRIDRLVAQSGFAGCQVVEGLFLQASASLVVLIDSPDSEKRWLISDFAAPQLVTENGLAGPRCVAYTIGTMLLRGAIPPVAPPN